MGYALIVGGGENGRYSIRLDFGEARKAELLAAFGTALNTVDLKIAQTQINLDAAETAEGDTLAYIDGIVTAAIADGSAFNTAFTDLYTQLLKDYKAQLISNEPIRIALRKLKDARAVLLKRVASYNQCVTTETRNAWCADYTDDAEGYVATMEIPGESDLILISPGAPYPDTFTTGVLSARELMSPSQAYFNAAILPGWQKDKPTYRWGTISSVDYVINTANVDLGSATSSAQSLDVNQATSLFNVPIKYMLCDSTVFRPGDRVVVQFVGQAWDNPRIVGFLDNPRPCAWPIIGLGSPSVNNYVPVFYTDSDLASANIWAAARSGSLRVEIRENRGPWIVMDFAGVNEALAVVGYEHETSWEFVNGTVFPTWFVRIQNTAINPQLFGIFDPTTPIPADAKLTIWIRGGPHAFGEFMQDDDGTFIGEIPRVYYPYEVRIYSGSSLVFNGAASENGFAAEGVTGNFGKAQGGIENRWGYDCSELDYLLFSQTGD